MMLEITVLGIWLIRQFDEYFKPLCDVHNFLDFKFAL